MLLPYAPWVVVAGAAALLWFPQQRRLCCLLLVGYGLALLFQLITVQALWPIGLLLLASCLITCPRSLRYLRAVGHLLFLVVAYLLGTHQFPGFHNLLVFSDRLTPHAVPYQLFLNFDKPLIGFWVLLAWRGVRLKPPNRHEFSLAVIMGSCTILLCLTVALWLHRVVWDPKWPSIGWLWAINNLFVVSATEEALFRGYLQERFRRWLIPADNNAWIAIAGSALLFGLLHYPGGLPWILLASLAGFGYGAVYHYAGWQSAVVTHFLFNLVHFALLTYPQLAHSVL